MTAIIALASAGPGETSNFAGYQSFGGSIGGFEVAAVVNCDQVRTKALLDSLLTRLKTEMLVLARQPGGLLERRDIRQVSPMQFGNEGIERSTNLVWWGNAGHPAQAITTSRQRGPLLGMHGAALIIGLDRLATDAALCAAVSNVVDTLVEASGIYP